MLLAPVDLPGSFTSFGGRAEDTEDTSETELLQAKKTAGFPAANLEDVNIQQHNTEESASLTPDARRWVASITIVR